jgi:hypothetical protein
MPNLGKLGCAKLCSPHNVSSGESPIKGQFRR